MAKPYVDSPIVGATKFHHLEDAVRAVEVAYVPHPVLGFK